MSQRLQHTWLEQAIYQKQLLGELTGHDCKLLDAWCIADYVGNPTMKQEPGDHRRAHRFFEDQGAYRKTVTYSAEQPSKRNYDVAIFATFIVVEINPDTDHTEFLVLMPRRNPEQEGGMYTGLMKSHNTDKLLDTLQQPEQEQQLAEEIGAVLNKLQSTPPTTQPSPANNWFKRLFKQGHSA